MFLEKPADFKKQNRAILFKKKSYRQRGLQIALRVRLESLQIRRRGKQHTTLGLERNNLITGSLFQMFAKTKLSMIMHE